MNGKKARALRKMLQVDLSSESEDKAHGAVAVGEKLIAQIQPDGNHTEREENIVEARTSENRYLYRTCKKILQSNKDPEVKLQLRRDLWDKQQVDKVRLITNESEEADKE